MGPHDAHSGAPTARIGQIFKRLCDVDGPRRVGIDDAPDPDQGDEAPHRDTIQKCLQFRKEIHHYLLRYGKFKRETRNSF